MASSSLASSSSLWSILGLDLGRSRNSAWLPHLQGWCQRAHLLPRSSSRSNTLERPSRRQVYADCSPIIFYSLPFCCSNNMFVWLLPSAIYPVHSMHQQPTGNITFRFPDELTNWSLKSEVHGADKLGNGLGTVPIQDLNQAHRTRMHTVYSFLTALHST